MRTLQNHSGSGVVTLPKDDLAKDDLLEDGEVAGGQPADIDRIGRRTYVLRFPEIGDDQLPELTECELINRLAAQRALAMNASANGLEG
ncbi:hypothetical protein GWK26_11895 [haloarchaeon 3A1-DGR]|nr:hypothetical protein GWK26_11895 [haloarchaeon 3A1-DGR]